jgi:alcohol dehydrogenase class IV
MNYDFLAPRRVVFGWGRRSEVGGLARDLGRRAFIVSGSRTLEAEGRLDELTSALDRAGVEAIHAGEIHREPHVEDVDRLTAFVREQNAGEGDLIIGIGGGSALDLAKAVSALATNRHGNTVQEFLEGVGRGLKLEAAPLPMLAIPTTSGTGSEATKNAVISSTNPPFKKSLRSDQMVPRTVLIDPELTVSVPPNITAWTGMDAITQLIESYISRRARPIPQALALQGLELAVPALAEAFENGNSRPARERMAHAAFLSGLALANSGLGMAHGVAAALGIHCDVPHGLACAVMLPIALWVNFDIRREELTRLAQVMTGRPDATAQDTLDCIDQLCERLRIPRRLSEIGVRPDQLGDLVRSSRGNSMDGNPRDVSDELLAILEQNQ